MIIKESSKIYKRFKRYFNFLRAKVTITTVVKDYKVYVRTKVSRYKLYKEFQILSVFERAWGSVTIDFIIKLFKFKNLVNNTSYNNILVIIKRFIKYNKFILNNESYSIEDLVDIVIREVISNYRLLNEFIIDKGTTFVSRFFIIFIAKLRMNSKLSIVFYL